MEYSERIASGIIVEEKWQLFIYCNAGRFEYEPDEELENKIVKVNIKKAEIEYVIG